MTDIIVTGAGGKMGQRIIAMAAHDPDVTIVAGIERRGHPLIGKKVGPQEVFVFEDLKSVLSTADVVIDFSSPSSVLSTSRMVAEARKAMVIGTTGLSKNDKEKLYPILGTIPVVYSPNMSVGANLLFKLALDLSQSLPSHDIEIVEIHHNEKEDAPSGTAQRLVEMITRSKGLNLQKSVCYGRSGNVGKRPPEQIGVHSLRGGDVVGEHKVYFFGPGECLELTHRVTTRDAFASGALQAAKWVVQKKPGIYDMKDVLGIQDFPESYR